MVTLEIILLMVAFGISSYTDIKHKEIPVWLFPLVSICYTGIGIVTGNTPGIYNIAGLLCMVIPFLLICLFGNMGGGDLIMFSAVGFILGADNLISYMVILMIVGMITLIITRSVKKELPIAPIAGISYVLFCVWRCLCLN